MLGAKLRGMFPPVAPPDRRSQWLHSAILAPPTLSPLQLDGVS